VIAYGKIIPVEIIPRIGGEIKECDFNYDTL
jgi:hypothetical protein